MHTDTCNVHVYCIRTYIRLLRTNSKAQKDVEKNKKKTITSAVDAVFVYNNFDFFLVPVWVRMNVSTRMSVFMCVCVRE